MAYIKKVKPVIQNDPGYKEILVEADPDELEEYMNTYRVFGNCSHRFVYIANETDILGITRKLSRCAVCNRSVTINPQVREDLDKNGRFSGE